MTRIIRVIAQPRGNMLLIGIGGSGRQSLGRLSAYIIGFKVFQIEVTKHYRKVEFREGEFKFRDKEILNVVFSVICDCFGSGNLIDLRTPAGHTVIQLDANVKPEVVYPSLVSGYRSMR